jgi:hypothetical protein
MNFFQQIPWTMGIWCEHLMKLASIKFPKGYNLKVGLPIIFILFKIGLKYNFVT